MGDQPGPTLVAAVQDAIHLVEAAGTRAGGTPASQLARLAGLPQAEAEPLLRTLTDEGYLRRLDDGAYVTGDNLGHRPAVEPGTGPAGQDLLDRVRPALAGLRDETSAAAYLTFYEDGEIRVAEIVDGPRAPRVDLWVGFADAGHATALGKCVLRQLDGGERDEYLSRHPLDGLTPRTITRHDELMRNIDLAVPAPVAMDREEYVLGTVCIAVPVAGAQTVGSLGISFRADRMYRGSQVREQLLTSAEQVTRGLSLPI
ncbi:IclR family transcriptional regulator [Streptomyces sp. NPDC088729]|uniref:IclR family transcriptional regulator n=1 Tax=Streptomyces sp. NPDC088729 TaxID=3365876 RepID=UPI0037FBC540